MTETSNPWMVFRIELDCGCGRRLEMRYQDPRPELGTPTECPTHGDTEVKSYSGVGR